MINLKLKIKYSNFVEIKIDISKQIKKIGYALCYILSDFINDTDLDKHPDFEFFLKYIDNKNKNDYLIISEIYINENARGNRTVENVIKKLQNIFQRKIILQASPLYPQRIFNQYDIEEANYIISDLKLKLWKYYESIGFNWLYNNVYDILEL